MNNNYSIVTTCPGCENDQSEIVLSLAPTPIEDDYLTKQIPQPTYPLDLALCKSCSLCYLPHRIDPDLTYSEYLYNTKVTVGLENHYKEYAEHVIKKLNLNKGSLSVDIGSNDGTLVGALSVVGMNAIGVDPAPKVAKEANDNGRRTINSYFTESLAKNIVNENGKAFLITANYMFANVPDLDKFLFGIHLLLDDDGVFIVQTGYHPDQFNILMFDYIYHEHFYYFTLLSLQHLFKKHGLEIIDVESYTPKGGSIRVYASKINQRQINEKNIELFLDREKHVGWNTVKPFEEFQKNLNLIKTKFIEKLEYAKKKGKSIVGIGASTSTTTLIYEFGLEKYLNYIVDDNVIKHDTFSPGHHIPVYPTQKLYSDLPDIIVVLAWQHQQSILSRHEKLNNGRTEFLVPFRI